MKRIEFCRKTLVVSLAFLPALIVSLLFWYGIIPQIFLLKAIAFIATILAFLLAAAAMIGLAFGIYKSVSVLVKPKKESLTEEVIIGILFFPIALLFLAALVIFVVYIKGDASEIPLLPLIYTYFLSYLQQNLTATALCLMTLLFLPCALLAFRMLKDVPED